MHQLTLKQRVVCGTRGPQGRRFVNSSSGLMRIGSIDAVDLPTRVSEAMPLCWDRVDLEQNVIKVGAAGETTPKTFDRYRDVIVCDSLAKDLAELGKEHAHQIQR